MDDFLKETKNFLGEAAQGEKNLHVVIGNESCDLDSVIAALTYSYFLHKTSASDSIHSLPVLNIPRSQSHLKTDSNFLLRQTGINPDHLTYRDDLDLHDLHQKGRLSLTLVDHNVLVGSNVSLEESVTMVIDHHQLERKPSDKVKLVHDLVGSCCSLVAGILLDSPEFSLTPQIAKMLIGTILVDTVNTSPEAGKTTPYDQEMLGRLLSLIPDLDTEKLYDDIQQAKNDVSALSKREILEKDQKQVTHGNRIVVMSSISTSLQTFLQGTDAKQALDSVLHDRNGQCVVVMTMQVEDGVPRREILVYSNNEQITQELADFLETDKEVQLDLQPLPCDLQYSLAYSQGNIKASRKKVLPLVKSFLEKSSVPQDDLLLTFDPVGSDTNSSAQVDFSSNPISSLVPNNMETGTTNQNLLFDPLSTAVSNTNNSASQDLLGLFDSDPPPTQPKISITLPKSPGEGFIMGSDLLGDFTEADIMESPLRTPDLMQSLSEASSGAGSARNSRPGSGHPSHTVTPPETGTPPNSLVHSRFLANSNNEFTLPSMNNAETVERIQQKQQRMEHQGDRKTRGDSDGGYPYTPHNSVADFQFDALAREHNLRTLNNSQMLREVEQKRKSLGGGEADLIATSDIGEESITFTPCNSFVSEQFGELYTRDSCLPTMNNAEMVQHIKEKRASMAGNVGFKEEEEEEEQEEDAVPFTPQNSFIESNFDNMAREHDLPSLNNADTVLRVQQKRSSLSDRLNETRPEQVMSPVPAEPPQSFSPFTPQNSYVESNMEKYHGGLDLSSLNDRLLDISLEGGKKSVIHPQVPNSLNFDPLVSVIPQNVVANGIAQEMLEDNPQNSSHRDLLDLNFDGGEDGDDGSHSTENHGNSSGIMGKEARSVGQSKGNQSSETQGNSSGGPTEDVAFSLAGELIEHVLENFQPSEPLVNKANDEEALVSVTMETVHQEKSSEVLRQQEQNLAVINPSTAMKKVPSSGQLIAVETDYLSKVDLFHGNYDLVSKQGDREVVESSSFRKISGEAPQTVRQEILTAISRESFDKGRGGTEEEKEEDRQMEEDGENVEKENERVVKKNGMMDEIEDRKMEQDDGTKDENGDGEKGVNEDRKIGDGLKKEEHVDNGRKIEARIQKDERDEDVSDLTPSETEEETENDSPYLVHQVADSLLDSVLKNAVDIVQSGEREKDESMSTTLKKPQPPSQSIFNFDTTEEMEESGSTPSDSSSPTNSTTTEASYRLSSPEAGGQRSRIMPREDNSMLSINSISSESLSSYTGMKSDVDVLERAERSMLSLGSISGESLSSFAGVKSDMNLEDLSPGSAGVISPVSQTTNQNLSTNQKLDVEPKEKVKVLFKLDSYDDVLQAGSVEVKEETQRVEEVKVREKLKVDSESRKEVYMTTAGRISIKVEDETVMSSALRSSEQTVMSSVKEDKTLMTSTPSNEGLPLMSVSSDPFESVDSVATVTTEEGELNKTDQSNEMTETESKLQDRLGGLDLAEDWQEDDIPGMPPAENEYESSDSEGSRSRHSSNSSHSSLGNSRARNSSLSAHPKKKITANFSILSDDLEDDGMDPADGLEWENDTPIQQRERIPEFSAQDEFRESKLWKGVEIGGKSMKIDLKVIEPYKKVLAHGGYYGDGLNAIIIFSGCYLPDRSRRDYQYVMDNLFMYVISTLETLVAEDYMIVYFHGATPRRQMPSFGWLKKCYQMIDRRLRKNLKSLLLVHPTLWLRTIVMMTRPFISAKFSSKLRFVRSLTELGQIIPMEYILVPEQVQQYDDRILQHHTPVTSPVSHFPQPLTSPY
ncbi:uncharacterized protein LOC111111795 isoform X1 [Crassostrea virginica]